MIEQNRLNFLFENSKFIICLMINHVKKCGAIINSSRMPLKIVF